MNLRVLVTRPQPGADRTAQELAARGFEPLVLPLTRTLPVPLEGQLEMDGFGAIAITSANAVRHAPSTLLTQIAHLPVYAVGERTGETARAAGLRVADMESGDASALVRRMAAAARPQARILVLCGRVRRDIVERGLAQAGFDVTALETYDTLSLAPSEKDVFATLDHKPVDAVLLYSALAADAFRKFSARRSLASLFGHTVCLAISERVAKHLPESASVRVAVEPTEEALLSLLAKPI